jgi:putative oxygen-independent coproporphyrinogen III oxidase
VGQPSPLPGPSLAPPSVPRASGARAPVALYVHVPFCVSLCPYCDFVVYAGAAARGPRARVEPFLRALAVELDLRADALDALHGQPGSSSRPPLETLYLGGGTPSLLEPHAIASLVGRVRARFGLADGAEITIESNPGPDERGDATALVDAGVTRISLGAQSFDPSLLRRLGRRHAAEDVVAAVDDARRAGIGSVSLDLLYDVPGQAIDAWASTLDAALGLAPDHVSAYALTLDDPDAEGLTGPAGDHLPTRSGAARWRAAAIRAQDEDRAAEQYVLVVDRLGAAGYRGYEISNWARPGHESRHNLVYWTRQPHEAVGPGAHAFDGTTRRWNAARLDRYLHALVPAAGAPAQLPPGGSEPLDARTASIETVMLALRLDSGLGRADAETGPLAPHLAWAIDAGLLEEIATSDHASNLPGPVRIRLTTRGRLVSNELFGRLV